jgi:subtilisin family serine protease
MRRILGALRKILRGHPECTRPSRPTRPTLSIEALEDRCVPAGDFRSVIGLDTVQSLYPYHGQGYTVAVLDTGIDYNHPDLGGGFGAGRRVVAGYDFINNDADPMDDNGHGTHLAGIIGSSNTSALGIAPQVNFVALKVLDASNNGSWTAVENALQWVVSHQSQYNIVGVNLSLGAGNYTSSPYNLLDDEFASLKSLGVFTAVASGNRFYTFNSQPGTSYPSVSPNVVSVGATWAGDFGPATFSSGARDFSTAVDRVVSLTQRGSSLSLMAPGAWINSTWLGGGTRTMAGTSMATAVVTGSAVLMNEAYDRTGRSAQATQDNILALMKSTGVNVLDGDDEDDNVTNTGLTFKRLNLRAAMDTLGSANRAPTLNPIANQTMQVGQTIQVPLVASDPENEPIRFSYRQIYLPAQAYQLDQLYGFTSTGNYNTNSRGVNEKWIGSANQAWYWIMPNGDVRRWAGTTAETLMSANLLATLDASYYADPAKLWNAPYAGMPPAVFSISGNTLSIRSPAQWLGTYSVEVTATDGHYNVRRTFNVTVTNGNLAPVLTAIPNQTITRAQRPLLVTLSATDANNDAITYSAQVVPVNGQAPPVVLSVQGRQLTITPAANFVGSFTIRATASDGRASDTKSFTVTVTNAGPSVSEISVQTMAAGQTSLNVTIPATDPDNDVLAFQAVAQTPNAMVYQLDQTHAFQPASANYYVNLRGFNEKWLIGRNNTWYCLLPDGRLYRWYRSMPETLQPANLIATLTPSFWTEPRLLWDAQPATTPALSFSWQGNQLTIQRPASLTGVFFIDVAVSDGLLTARRTFQVTLN